MKKNTRLMRLLDEAKRNKWLTHVDYGCGWEVWGGYLYDDDYAYRVLYPPALETWTVLSNNPRTIRWTRGAYAALLAEHRAGKRQCDLAKELKLSSTRVRQVLCRAERYERGDATHNPLEQLSTRAANALRSSGINTVAELQAALSAGLRLRDIPNVGTITAREILDVLEVES